MPKKKKQKIRWADSLFNECNYAWDAREGETIEYVDAQGRPYSVPAISSHRCIKQRGHEGDPTNDDHQCCCGNTSE